MNLTIIRTKVQEKSYFQKVRIMNDKKYQKKRRIKKPKEKERGKGWTGFDGAEHPTHKKVIQMTMSGVEVEVWDSLSIAADANQVDPSNLSKVCKGKGNRKSLKGFKWAYKDE